MNAIDQDYSSASPRDGSDNKPSTVRSRPWWSRSSTELQTSRLSSLILSLYRALDCQRRWRLGRVLVALALRLERGAFFSATARDILRTFHGITVGAYSYGACMRVGYFPPGVVVGRYASIGYNARMVTSNHPMDRLSTHPFFYDHRLGIVHEALPVGSLVIGDDAWIGDYAIITPGCKRVGIGAIVGAGAVVTKDVPDFAVVVGNPARLLRFRFPPEVIELILASRWWERPLSDCRRFLAAMTNPLGDCPSRHPLLREIQDAV